LKRLARITHRHINEFRLSSRGGDPHWALILYQRVDPRSELHHQANQFKRQLSAQSSMGFLAVKRSSINMARQVIIQFACGLAQFGLACPDKTAAGQSLPPAI
jgi:hypothetical protein